MTLLTRFLVDFALPVTSPKELTKSWDLFGEMRLVASLDESSGRSFEGVCVNYRHPGPRHGEPRVGSAPDGAFPLDPVDPVQSFWEAKRTLFLL